MATTEPFPALNTAYDQSSPSQDVNGDAVRRRRKSSGFKADPRGDTGTPSLATSFAHLNAASGRVGTVMPFSRLRSLRRPLRPHQGMLANMIVLRASGTTRKMSRAQTQSAHPSDGRRGAWPSELQTMPSNTPGPYLLSPSPSSSVSTP